MAKNDIAKLRQHLVEDHGVNADKLAALSDEQCEQLHTQLATELVAMALLSELLGGISRSSVPVRSMSLN